MDTFRSPALLLAILLSASLAAPASGYSYSGTATSPSGQPVLVGEVVLADVTLDVSDISAGTNYASGTCKVAQNGSALPAPFSYVCATDRDNDGVVTSQDPSGSSDSDGFDDDFGSEDVAAGGQGSLDICFRADTDSSGSSGGYPTSAIWDTVSVFVILNTALNAVATGPFDVEVHVSDALDGGCTPNAHSHSGWT
jgi:hypothetical protein